MAACKVIHLTDKTTSVERKTIDKEMRVHAALKHRNVLEFINAVVVEPDGKMPYVPAVYMLLEFAAGGDLFDKIGDTFSSMHPFISSVYIMDAYVFLLEYIAPDVGVSEDVAHFYFCQVIDGLVSSLCS